MDRNHKKHTDDGYDFTSKKIKQEGELEVTGVSRSGRVRKKSSKLTDFESLDEIDIRTNTRVKKEKYEPTTPTTVSRPIKKERLVKEELLSDVDEELASPNYQVKQEQYSDDSENDGYPANEDSSMESLGSEMDEMDEGELDQGDGNGFQPITADDSSDEASSQQRGLYGSDKSNKKKLIIKDGKILGKAKTPKKDKGKTRLTAYMLWAKEIRQELMRANPNLNFSQTSKKLGELWGRVPLHEKYIWKRRANRATALAKKQQGNLGQTRPSTVVQAPTVQEQQSNASQVRKAKLSPTRRFVGKQTTQQQQQQQLSHQQQVLSTPTQVITSTTATSISTDSKSQVKGSLASSEPSVFKPVSTSAMDVAAHLKLLGESLTIIGERLTEHEGQIAVSGSFSLLLDSLLCALGPLLCLTQQVPQMNVVPQDQLSQIMDNIAYIMPGL